MSQIGLSGESHLYYPALWNIPVTLGGLNPYTTMTLDATAEKFAMIGQVYIDGRAASKTLSAAGGGKIGFRAGTTTFANGATVMDIGLQGVSAVAGPLARPDGTFTTKATFTGGGITTNTWTDAVMTSGSKTLSHGELIAVVFDMVNIAGVDKLGIAIFPQYGFSGPYPLTNWDVNGAGWLTTGGGNAKVPNCSITFDDGTLGIISFAPPAFAGGTVGVSSATDPDEIANIFQVPWACKVDAAVLPVYGIDADDDYTVSLYSDPLGTPTLLASVTKLIEQGTATGVDATVPQLFDSEVTLQANTDYAIALKGLGSAGTSRTVNCILPSAAYRTFYGNISANFGYAARKTSGAFGSQDTTKLLQIMVRISSLDDGAGGASGNVKTFNGLDAAGFFTGV